jgi:glutamyl-Q tRNA(Asp) synthetase
LVAAVGSFLQARFHHGLWLIRVEDIDPPREVTGSARRIIADLARLGLQSDQPILFQSTRTKAYENAIQTLINKGDAFNCCCSRKQLPANGIYPGTCRHGLPQGQQARSIRIRTESEPVTFTDRVMGRCQQNLQKEVGDFVIRRADGLAAYQLAVAVDDAYQGVTEIVRGADLLESTARQIWLQQKLGLPTPGYMHLPLVVGRDGRKLSKCEDADPVRHADPAEAVHEALVFLGQKPPAGLNLDSLWNWAIDHWRIDAIPRQSIYRPSP